MTLRTPRRRISPRAKRRYRAIREFFRRALGSPSQQDIKINSSIAVNVTDLKHKIVGIEHQLNEVNRHCRDLAGLESDFRRDTENLLPREGKRAVESKDRSSSSDKRTSTGTKLLYKQSDNSCSKSDESSYACVFESNDSTRTTPPRNVSSEETEAHNSKVNNRKNMFSKNNYGLDDAHAHECSSEPREHKTRSAYDNSSAMYSTSSFRSLGEGRGARARDVAPGSGRPHRRRDRPRRRRDRDRAPDAAPPSPPQPSTKRHHQHPDLTLDSPLLYEDRHIRSHRSRTKGIDQEFISDLINRQYKPVKLFGRRESDMSQFSAPVCRDQEFPVREDVRAGSELCSCCRDAPASRRSRYLRSRDLTDMRSICDTRLYSSKRQARHDPRHRRCYDVYNDSDLYDLIPVKEKSSPKSRRKFIEDNAIPYYYYKEVPPSPRTMRPRLNLKAQYYDEYDDYIAHAKHPHRRHASRPRRNPEPMETYDSDFTSEIVHHTIRKDKHKPQKVIKVRNANQIHQDIGTMSSLPYSYANEQNNVTVPHELSLNKTQDTDLTVDKTDKALCEIKDILQNFLHEIKKEATPSQCDKSDITAKINEKQTIENQDNAKMKAGTIPNSTSFNYSPAPCINSSYIAPFTNPCCYPMMPMCPMNCMQSSYMIPTGSFPCHGCTSTKEVACPDCSKNKKDAANETFDSTRKSNETEELIKEIYKYVAQSPKANHKNHHGSHSSSRRKDGSGPAVKVLTSRSAGGSTARAVRHDANVGTPELKCYSKSCEAIRSRLATTDTSYTNGTHSDTILEKLSLEPTQSDTELSSESLSAEKSKRSKLTRVLRKFGLLVKKKKDSVEELDESESSIEVDVKRRPPPFRQDIASYMMHGQEYYDPRKQHGYPPPNAAPYPYPPNMYGPPAPYPPYGAGTGPPHTGVHAAPTPTIHEHAPLPPQQPQYVHTPSAPPYPHSYDPHYGHASPQVPLCLKEVEVKSTGTQSEKKMSFFQKIVKNPPPRVNRWQDSPRTQTTQTQVKATKQNRGLFSEATKPKKGLFSGFKNLRDEINADPVKFQLKTQAELANGDFKIRNAMLKKLFHKRNPFSPRNMFMKTLLGKDDVTFAQPYMKQVRPRMLM